MTLAEEIEWTAEDDAVDALCIAKRFEESQARRAAGRKKWHRS